MVCRISLVENGQYMGCCDRACLLQLDGSATGVGEGRRCIHRRGGDRGPCARKGGQGSKKGGCTEAGTFVDSGVLHRLSCRSGGMVGGSVGPLGVEARAVEDRVSKPECGCDEKGRRL